MARQFDVYRLRDAAIVMIVQSDLLDETTTGVVAPLFERGRLPQMRGLNPEILVAGETYVLAPQLMATVAVGDLGTRLGTADDARDAVTRAVGVMLSGV